MARLLLDEQLPRRLKTAFKRHSASTVGDMRWLGFRNGLLLRRAEPVFDVLVTMDKGIPFQQAVAGLEIGVLLILARSNRFPELGPHIEQIEAAADAVKPGAVVELDLTSPRPSAGG